jgi:hypothetical protein
VPVRDLSDFTINAEKLPGSFDDNKCDDQAQKKFCVLSHSDDVDVDAGTNIIIRE